MRLELFPFLFRDPVTGKWVRARYRATQQEIARRHAEYEITGPAEIRDVDADGQRFSPHYKLMTNADLRRFSEEPPELANPAGIGVAEARLVQIFLRRYVTYCARRGNFAAMNGAARLFTELAGRLD